MDTREKVTLGCSPKFWKKVEDSCHQLRTANSWGTAAHMEKLQSKILRRGGLSHEEATVC